VVEKQIMEEKLNLVSDKMMTLKNNGMKEKYPVSLIDINCWEWPQGVGLFGLYRYYEMSRKPELLTFLTDWYDRRMEEGIVEKNVNTTSPMLTLTYLYEITKKESYLAFIGEWADWIMEEKGLIRTLVDTQDFDQGAIESIKKNPNHIEISASEYANPFNKGAYVNKLDFVILASLEVDVDFNCNVVVGSDGVITGAQGGHPDTAAGAKCTIVIAPLLQGRIPAICTNVTTVTTPGETVDVVITDYGIAINPRRQDLIECMKDVNLPFCTIEELRDKAYAMVGEPEPVQFGERIVGIIEGRDGTVMDVVREIKEYCFE